MQVQVVLLFLQTLEGLVKQAKDGKPVSEDDIPPTVAISASKPSPSVEQPAPSVAPPSVPTRHAPQPPTAHSVAATLPSAVSAEPHPTAPRAVIQPVQMGQPSPGVPSVSIAKAALSAPAVSLETGPASGSTVSTAAERGKLNSHNSIVYIQ